MLKADLHIHTKYSMDCDTPLELIIARCQELGVNCIAVADHATIEGAIKMQQIAPFRVVIAEEVLTDQGEIMGMFLKEGIPSRQPLIDVISRIKSQGGLVSVQHPFDTGLRRGVGEKVICEIREYIDVVEVFNARSPLAQFSRKARRFAEKHNLPQSAGSDAHTPGEIGNAYVEMPEFTDKESFLESLRQGKINGHLSSPFVHFNSLARILRKSP